MEKIRNNYFKEFVYSAAVYAVTLLILGLLRFVWRDVGMKLILEYSIVSALFFGIQLVFTVWRTGRKAYAAAFLLSGSFFIFFTGERLISSTEIEWYLLPYWMNILLLFGIGLIFYGISGKASVALLGTDFLFVLTAVVNAFLKQVRGRGLDVIDAYSVSTAMKVADNYHFRVTRMMAAGFVINLLLMWILLRYDKTRETENKERTKKERTWAGAAGRVFCCILPLFLIGSIPFGSFWKKHNYVATYSSDRNGILFNLLLEIPDLVFMPPSGYSPETAERLLLRYQKTEEKKEVTQYPNIIVIMNESLADYSVLRELDTNQEVLPFLSGLKENTVKGYSYASIYGGNTATSEYEFLTGDSNILFNTMPYSTMIQGEEEVRGLPSQLRSIGYRTVAMHPYSNSAYRRSVVYPNLGFDELYFQEDFEDTSSVRNGLYVSDAANYKKIISILEQKKKEERIFLFNVTMQNHAPYQGIEKTIEFQDTDGYDEVEQYLTLANESDKAFETLLNGLKDFPEPVIVLMFGDHQPSFETDFNSYLFGKRKEDMTSEENMQKYLVPFYLWANYEIEEKEGLRTSMNYLALPLLEAAGIPKTPYQSYLCGLQEEYPVISCSGIIDGDGARYSQSEKEALIPEYLQLIYYHMSEETDSNQSLFGYE